MDGILLIDKPKGITSFDVIRRLRGNSGRVKMGHAGTLDPRATGLLLIGVGKATKELAKLIKLPKTYKAEIVLGISTDTGDMDGTIIEQKNLGKEMPEEKITDAVMSMKGTHSLPVPAYSAIKQGGVPLYKKARRGEKIDVPVKEMIVREVAVHTVYYEDNQVIIKAVFDVESGTYIRSLIAEVGRKLGVPATLKELRRTRIGNFKIEDARPLP
jgi:tRNA pseudouridine55 synthase